MVTVNCAWCGKEKQVYPVRLRQYKNQFCNKECADAWQEVNTTGENSPTWKGGKVKIACLFCGKEKNVWPGELEKRDNHFCNHSCFGKWRSQQGWSGVDSPKWKDRIKVNCACCGKEKEVTSYEKRTNENHFCNNECFGKWTSENWRGKDHPAWKRATVNCSFCGNTLEREQWWHNKQENHFCNNKCYGEWRSINIVGEKTSSWLGGISFEPYPTGWRTRLKEQIRERDNRTCQICGKNELENGRKLDVHHIDYNKDNLDTDNLISLCHVCHIRTNHNREYWQSYFTGVEEVAANG